MPGIYTPLPCSGHANLKSYLTMRRALPTSYASRPLPGTHCTSSPNTFMVNKAAKKARESAIAVGSWSGLMRRMFSRSGASSCALLLQAQTAPPAPLLLQIGACSGCGGKCLELKFCARCRTAKYCSRACQVGMRHQHLVHFGECMLSVCVAAAQHGSGPKLCATQPTSGSVIMHLHLQ